MMYIYLLLIFIIIALLGQNKRDFKTKEETSSYKKAGILTYQHFRKANSDEEIKKFLLANDQDPKDFNFCSRERICEKMKMKSEQTGRPYTRFPY